MEQPATAESATQARLLYDNWDIMGSQGGGIILVPTLRVGMPDWTLCGPWQAASGMLFPGRDAERREGIPTQSVGTRK
jgi:hypothetical protein